MRVEDLARARRAENRRAFAGLAAILCFAAIAGWWWAP